MANVGIPKEIPSRMNAIPSPLAVAFGGVTGEGAPHYDLQGVVARALRMARASGRDYVGQTDAAARAVVAVRPDLTMSQATVAVNWLRDHIAS